MLLNKYIYLSLFKDMFSKKHIVRWLLLAFAIETICVTWGLKIASYSSVVSIIYFIGGISIPMLVILIPPAEKSRIQPAVANKFSKYFKWLAFVAMMVMAYITSRYWFDLIPIDIDYADMLPVIKVMNERLIDGQWKHVYDTIPEIWNGTKPVYLPAMWIPFSPAVLFNFDLRWITVACLLFAFSIFLFKLNFNKKNIEPFVALIIAVILFWWLFAEDDMHGVLTMSEEGVVIIYYAFLALAIFSGNIFLIAIATSLCMLSRYALIGWVPAFIFYLLLNKKKKETLIFIGTGFLCFLFLFIIPFGWNAFTELLALPAKYIDFAGRVWNDSREVFWLSLGFAKFFGPGKTALLHDLLIILTFTVPLLFVGVCYYRNKKKKLHNIPIATLKISLVIFFNFIDVPYLYLFYTSSFVSLMIVGGLVNAERGTQNA
ncbi:MAG: hypothetical protein JST75_01530 [Bacteroidetes bacterium]|nr:hypothetical protein [Bacteroidota bacterium]